MKKENKTSINAVFIIVVLLVSIASMLVLTISINLFVDLAYDNESSAISRIVKREMRNLEMGLAKDMVDLLGELASDEKLQEIVFSKNKLKIASVLGERLNIHRNAADAINVKTIRIYDEKFQLLNQVSNAHETQAQEMERTQCGLVHEEFSSLSENIQTDVVGSICKDRSSTNYYIVGPLGEERPPYYIQLIADMAFKSRELVDRLGMPIRLSNGAGEIHWQSDDWPEPAEEKNYLFVEHWLDSTEENSGLRIQVSSDNSVFQARMDFMTIAVVIITILIVGPILVLSRIAACKMRLSLNSVRDSARSLAEGKYHPVIDAPFAETEDLVDSFNKMAEKVSHLIANLTEEIQERQIMHTRLELSRKGLEEKNQQLDTALRAANEATRVKAEFLANMSHEIRTPLNGVLGMLDIMKYTPLNEEQKEYINIACRSGDMLMEQINDTLDFSKLEAGKLELEHVEYTLRTEVEDVISVLMVTAREKHLDLLLEFSPKIDVNYLGDPARIRQIIMNLVNNAIKFTSKGQVKVSLFEESRLASSIVLRCEVSDTGIGIPVNVQKKIFNAFVQADSSTTRQYGGTGLGLSICYQLVKKMGGEIGVVSDGVSGSTLWFSVEQELADTVSLKHDMNEYCNVPKVDFRLSTCTILLVEDHHINRRVAIAMLERMGLQNILVAENGHEALTLLNDYVVDLVFMDCQMPVIDGFEATRRIRKLASEKNRVPVIAMTANAMEGDRDRCIKAGMNDYVAKPIDPEQLIRVLKKWTVSSDD
ncbi:MAG: response regulator [Gammaproteobacteria bacterium]|nr:response regulator [Gammaproteobacteria bacterium]